MSETRWRPEFLKICQELSDTFHAETREIFQRLITEGGYTDIDADLIADDGYAAAFMNNVTGSDPLLGAMNTTAKADWGYGEGSPCIGAGSGGADIGFAAAA